MIRFRKLLVLLLLVLTLAGCVYRKAMKTGDELYAQGNYEAALQQYQVALAKKPDSEEAQLKVADAKAAVDAVAGMEVSKSAEMAWNATADAALEAARADDTNVVIDLSPEEAQAFADAVADVVNGYVAEVNGEAALAKMRGE